MSVASHLGIRIGDYDPTIATFIPDYAEMLDVAARVAALSLNRLRPTRLVSVPGRKRMSIWRSTSTWR